MAKKNSISAAQTAIKFTDKAGLSREEQELICCYRQLDDIGREIHSSLIRKCAESDKSESQQGDVDQPFTNVYQFRPRHGNDLRHSLSVLPGHLPKGTISALSQLLAQAKRGEVIGVAFAVMYKGRDYLVDATDEARRSPTFARGMVAKLDDELARL